MNLKLMSTIWKIQNFKKELKLLPTRLPSHWMQYVPIYKRMEHLHSEIERMEEQLRFHE